jgi:peroxiredoxin Q/BCP
VQSRLYLFTTLTNATALQLRDNTLTMPAELRKRKEAPPAPVRPAKKASSTKGKKDAPEKTVVETVQAAVAETVEAVKDAVMGDANGEAAKPVASKGGAPATGDSIDLASFGGEVETHDGDKTTLAKLVEESKAGVVLFTYPKASTPGCESFPDILKLLRL